MGQVPSINIKGCASPPTEPRPPAALLPCSHPRPAPVRDQGGCPGLEVTSIPCAQPLPCQPTELHVPCPNAPQEWRWETQAAKKAELGAPPAGHGHSPPPPPALRGNWSWALGQLKARGMNVTGPKALTADGIMGTGLGVLPSPLPSSKEEEGGHRELFPSPGEYCPGGKGKAGMFSQAPQGGGS